VDFFFLFEAFSFVTSDKDPSFLNVTANAPLLGDLCKCVKNGIKRKERQNQRMEKRMELFRFCYDSDGHPPFLRSGLPLMGPVTRGTAQLPSGRRGGQSPGATHGDPQPRAHCASNRGQNWYLH